MGSDADKSIGARHSANLPPIPIGVSRNTLRRGPQLNSRNKRQRNESRGVSRVARVVRVLVSLTRLKGKRNQSFPSTCPRYASSTMPRRYFDSSKIARRRRKLNDGALLFPLPLPLPLLLPLPFPFPFPFPPLAKPRTILRIAVMYRPRCSRCVTVRYARTARRE